MNEKHIAALTIAAEALRNLGDDEDAARLDQVIADLVVTKSEPIILNIFSDRSISVEGLPVGVTLETRVFCSPIDSPDWLGENRRLDDYGDAYDRKIFG